MEEKLKSLKKNLKSSLKTFEEIINENFSSIVRDAAIQRFEYSFELFWKYIKEYLRVVDGIICNSPKAAFRETFKTGKINEEETTQLLEMTDDRNLISHTYDEELANYIYKKLKKYYFLMEKIFKNL